MNLNPRTAIVILYDILVAAFAWLAAYWLRFNLAVPPEFLSAAVSMLVWVVPLQAAVFWGFGLYRGTWRFASLPDLKRIVLAAGLAALLIPLVLVLFRVSAVVPRSVLILDPLLLVLVMGGSRLAYRAWKDHRRASVLQPSKPALAEATATFTSTEDVPFVAFVEEHLDREAYLGAYPDVRSAGMDAVQHWLEYGMAEGRSFFPDAKVIHGDPALQVEGSQWLHFTWRSQPVAVWIYDQAENALFTEFVEQHMDREAYLEAYPDIRLAGVDPVKHWLEHGVAEGRSFFPDAKVIHGDPALQVKGSQWLHFTWRGKPVAVWIYDQAENALFTEFVEQHMDREAYLEAYPDIRLAGVDPVKHWLEHGVVEGRVLYPGATVVFGEIAARFDETHWKRFTWRGNPVAVQIKVPIKSSLITQIEAQARHEPAVLAAGASALGNLRQLVGPDLLGRSGVDVRSIFAAIPERPDVVVLMPHLRVGDLEKFAADLIDGLRELGRTSILVLVTEDTAKTALGWESLASLAPFREARVVFWRDIYGYFKYEDPRYLARLLNALRPSRILVTNSRLGLEVVAKYGKGLSHIAKLYCVYFGFGLNGPGAHYAARFPHRTLPVAVGLTDNELLATALRRLWGELPGPGIAALPLRLEPAGEFVLSARLEARRMRTEDASRSLKWMWFSRGEAFNNGAAILAELARMRPADQFDFLEVGEGGLDKLRFDLPNIRHRGVLADASSADFRDYDGLLVTDLFEGMPRLALQLSQHATPMVLADVGGLRDTFDTTSVFFARLDQDTHSVVTDFACALESVASLTSSETLAMAEAASVQALARHAPEVYQEHLANLFDIPAGHV